MSHYWRWRKPGAWLFFTVVTYHRQPVFNHETARKFLHNAIIQTQRSHPFEIFASVLMPNHLHCIWILPSDDDDYSTRWRLIKSRTTHGLLADGWSGDTPCQSRIRAGEKTLWQRRYWERILKDDADVKRHLDYLHYNPVKHGLVKCAGDWPYSSFRRFVELEEYTPDWGEAMPDNLKKWDTPNME